MIYNIIKYVFKVSLISLISILGVLLSLQLYVKINNTYNRSSNPIQILSAHPVVTTVTTGMAMSNREDTNSKNKDKMIVQSAMIDAPEVKQNPELPSGCELTALTMLLQFYGIKKGKMELLPEMKVDPTPIRWSRDGSIAYWGNPNTGYVGDITAKQKGFGIYHAGLFGLLQKYIPSGVDLTRNPFTDLEQKVSQGIPVIVWTTISFTVPAESEWVVWDSPLGPIQTTFLEHSVLLVGYDENHIYVNDPLSGKKQYKIDKQQFIASWKAMGMQALTYNRK